MEIAIVGSGIGGLSAAWSLGGDHRVTVYERHPRAGIGAHAVAVGGGTIDVPLRVLYPAYYPSLFRILDESGIATEPVDAAASFGDDGGRTYFRYANHALGPFTVPLVPPASLLASPTRRILVDLARYLREAPRDRARGELASVTIGDYLRRGGYSDEFASGFLVPCFAGINTCSYDDVRGYPAELIVDYFRRGFIFSRVRRAVGGASEIAVRLSSRIAASRLGVAITSVKREADGVVVRDSGGDVQRFDHVVFASQANQVGAMLEDASALERSTLEAFRYDRVRVVVHSDTALAPRSRSEWAPVNYLVAPGADRPMITIWVNALQRSLRGSAPVFQTVSPFREPAAGTVLADAELERPVVTLRSAAALASLERMHAEPDRRVWFCGSYASVGIPLLESAAVSATRVADAIRRRASS